MKPITFDRFIRFMAAVAGVAVAYLLLRRLRSVLTPFFVAWLIAYLLYPIVCFFQYKCRLRSRALSILVTLVLLCTVFGTASYFIIPPVIEEVVRLKDIVVHYVSTDSTATSVTYQIETFIKRNIDLNDITSMMTFTDVSSFLEQRVPQLVHIVRGSLSAVIGLISSLIAIIYMFFILLDYEAMSRGLHGMVPAGHRGFVSAIMKDVEDGMNAYFRGQSIIALLVGIMFAIGFAIIDFPLAIPLGLFIGFLNLVPYLQTLGVIPAIILALLKAHDTGQSFWGIILAAFVVFVVVQSIQDWVLTPRIMGKVTGLNAAVILLSLSVWGSLLGFVGLIIALPLTTLLVSYYKRYVLEYVDDEREETEGDAEAT